MGKKDWAWTDDRIDVSSQFLAGNLFYDYFSMESAS